MGNYLVLQGSIPVRTAQFEQLLEPPAKEKHQVPVWAKKPVQPVPTVCGRLLRADLFY